MVELEPGRIATMVDGILTKEVDKLMRVLIIKTSSLGDIIHTLPALTDAVEKIPGIRFDWAVEEAFSEIPAWHPAVDKIIPVAIRRWRKHPIDSLFGSEWKQCKRELRKGHYDAVIDAQGSG